MALCSDALAAGWSGVISFPGMQVLEIPWSFLFYFSERDVENLSPFLFFPGGPVGVFELVSLR